MEKEKDFSLKYPEKAIGIIISNDSCENNEHEWKITKKWVWIDFDDVIEDKEHPRQFQTYKAYSQSCKNCNTGSDGITKEKIPRTKINMLHFEGQTGKHSIWNGRLTIAFKEYLTTLGE